MRSTIWLLTMFGTALASCGKQEIALPADPVDRAATCAAVAASQMREGSNNLGALAFEQQGHLMHYALLEGAATPIFSQDQTAAVVKRMPEVEAGVTGGKWQPLVAQCAAAYPATVKITDITLPADPMDARLGCYALASFITGALQQQDATYPDQLKTYMDFRRDQDDQVGAAYAARGITSDEAKDKARKQALSKIVKLGSPMAVMTVCLEKYPAS